MLLKRSRFLKMMIAVVLIVILVFRLFGMFEKLNYEVDDINYVELSINGIFDTTVITDVNDVEAIIDSINSSKPTLPKIGLHSGGYTLYNIRFYFQDESFEDFEFITCERDYALKTSKMVRLPEWEGGYFKGDLEFAFYELVKKNNPTEKNMEWHNSFCEGNYR